MRGPLSVPCGTGCARRPRAPGGCAPLVRRATRRPSRATRSAPPRCRRKSPPSCGGTSSSRDSTRLGPRGCAIGLRCAPLGRPFPLPSLAPPSRIWGACAPTSLGGRRLPGAAAPGTPFWLPGPAPPVNVADRFALAFRPALRTAPGADQRTGPAQLGARPAAERL